MNLHQHKVHSFSKYISFLFLHLPILLFSADHSQDDEDNRDKFTCIYCMKDFAKRNYLLNHVHKNKKCKEKHKGRPYTNANYHRRHDRPFKCKFPKCNGSYASERNREIHYNQIHGLWKSNKSIKKGGLREAVCRFPPNRKKPSQSKLKGNNLYYLSPISICIKYRYFVLIPITFKVTAPKPPATQTSSAIASSSRNGKNLTMSKCISTYSLILIIQVNPLQQETTHPLPRSLQNVCIAKNHFTHKKKWNNTRKFVLPRRRKHVSLTMSNFLR